MKQLEKIIKRTDVSLETKAKIIYTLVFLITMYRCESWTIKKADKKEIVFLYIYNVVLEESFVDTLDCQKDKQVGPRANQA